MAAGLVLDDIEGDPSDFLRNFEKYKDMVDKTIIRCAYCSDIRANILKEDGLKPQKPKSS